MKKVGFIGVGAMGRGMVKNLLKAGYSVTAFDLSDAALKAVAELGARTASSPPDAAKGSDIVFTSLPTPTAVRSVVLGTEGILGSMEPGTYIVDMSTIDPHTVREITAQARARGVEFLDAPVSGGPGGAGEGTLAIMVGGYKDAFDQVRPVLEAMGKNIFYIGESGTAQVIKLAHNMIVAANAVALGEAFLAGVKSGLPAKTVAEVISKSVGRSGVLEIFGPKILNNDYDKPLFALKLMHKDLGLYLKMAEELRLPAVLGSLIYQLYTAAQAGGRGDKDHTAVCQVLEEMAGSTIARGA